MHRGRSILSISVLPAWLLAPVLAFGEPAAPHSPATTESTVTATEGLARLKDGNDRYAKNEAIHPDQTPERLASLAAGQHPFAVILSCADSRVPPELVFDQGLGDIFVVRVAGNTLDGTVLGSIEYAVEHLGSSLIVVLGHEKCGAVQAALSGHAEGGHIPSLTKPIAPVIAEAKKMPGDPVHNAVLLNARRVAKQLSQSGPVLKPRIASGKLEVVVAVYDVTSGRVTFEK